MPIIGQAQLGSPQTTPVPVDVPLELFGGLCTELEAGDLPEGSCPLNQDMDFEVGATFTRSGLSAMFAGQISGYVNYAKTFTMPNGDNQLLLLDSSGNFYYEDTTNNPGTLVFIDQVLPGSYASSITAFDREFISFDQNGFGYDVPRQWDGQFFDRVTQDGPGAPPSVAENITELDIVAAPIGITQPPAVVNSSENVPIRGLIWSNGPGLNGSGNVITIFYAVASGPVDPNIYVGANVVLTGFLVSGALNPNGVYPIFSIQDLIIGGVLYHTFSVISTASGHEIINVQTGASYQATLATVFITTPSSTIVDGTQIVIAGASISAWDASWTVLNVLITSGMNILNTSLTANVATYTFSLNIDPTTLLTYNPPVAGQLVTVVGSINGGGVFNVINAMIASVVGSTFTVDITSSDVLASSDVGTATVQGTAFQFDPATVPAFAAAPILGNSGNGTLSGSGSLAAGVRQAVVMFLTRKGYITKPSPPITFNLSGEGSSIVVSNIPTGPPNVVARIIAFTAANGAYFFYIPLPVTINVSGTRTTYSSTVINDNVTTQATFNFTDTILLNSFGASIDSPGNDFFNNIILSPVAGFYQYASRIATWGELNKVQNFLGMAFDGGSAFTQRRSFGPGVLTEYWPLGWTLDPTNGPGGNVNDGVSVFGSSWAMIGDGTTAIRGMIVQPAYIDAYNVRILLDNTQYSFRVRLQELGTTPTQGSFTINIFSPSQGLIGSGSILATGIQSGYFGVYQGTLITTQKVLPSDIVMQICSSGTLTNGTILYADELAIFPTAQPFLQTNVRMSYVINPETFDGVTGNLDVSQLNGQAVRQVFQLRDNLYMAKENSLFSTTKNDSEPSAAETGWTISTISSQIGTASVRGVTIGEEWAVLVSKKGAYMFNGQEPMKMSQEIQPTWDTINWNNQQLIWTLNDIVQRRLFFGVPVNGSTIPNQIFMCNYRELNDSWSLAQQGPIHIAYSGKLISWDMSRKWSPWNIPANCGAIIKLTDNSDAIVFGWTEAMGKLEQLAQVPAANGGSVTSDDGTVIIGQYNTFFFVNREMEQQMQLGGHRKLYTYLAAFVSGSGTLFSTITSDSLTSPRTKALPNRTLQASPGYDMEMPINWSGDRSTFQFSTAGVGAFFKISKLMITMNPDRWTPIRGRV